MSEETRKFSEGIQAAIKDKYSIPEPAAEDYDADRQQAMQGLQYRVKELEGALNTELKGCMRESQRADRLQARVKELEAEG